MTIAAASQAAPGRGMVAVSVVASLALHAGIVAAFLAMRPAKPPPMPTIYQVDLVAAAPGAPSPGVVTPTPTPPPEPATKSPPRPKSEEIVPVKTKTPPRRTPALATPSVSEKRVPRNTPAPTAAGGEEGGRGTDVANIRTEGIQFPYPSYLTNIVRQIALGFRPPRGSQLKAEVAFLIQRDGTVTGFRFLQRSGSFTFDLEAQGAVEAAAVRFGPLPAGYREDVLPVIFSFDPRLIR